MVDDERTGTRYNVCLMYRSLVSDQLTFAYTVLMVPRHLCHRSNVCGHVAYGLVSYR